MTMSCKEDLLGIEKKCHTKGLTLTKMRQRILSLLVDSSAPLSAYDLVNAYNDTYNETIQAMTVYRALDYLTQENLAHRLNFNNKYMSCSKLSCCEDHGLSQFFICKKCNKVYESPLDEAIVALIYQHAAKIGHEVSVPHVEVEGICSACR